MFKAMQFSGFWRDYQQRVLDEFELHLDDDRINVVAAPGSGKTVLGLELVRRLGRPAILLSPTLTIRNQWFERLVPLFMAQSAGEEFLSHDLGEPATLTSATYQSLHAICAEEAQPRFTSLVEWARQKGGVTLVLDEAHHLRREWWRALDNLIESLDDVRIVALTATPPYDAPLAEWRRFEEACGPVDIEIGIPELVRNGDLCPHQDHVVLSLASPDLLALLDKRREAVSRVVAELRADEALAEGIEAHPWLTNPEDYVEPILDKPTMLSSMLVHLAATGRQLPRAPLELLGVRAETAPMQTERWTEALLNSLLYDLGDTSPLDSQERKLLAQRLHKLGLIEGVRVRLGETKRIVGMMAGDRAKIESVCDIARREAEAMGEDLRMVVLADHVRAGELPRRADALFTPAKLGVATLFESLRRECIEGQTLGVLTGTLVILPRSACGTLDDLLARRAIAAEEISLIPMPHCDSHCRLVASGAANKVIVSLITELFERGEITILAGTQALLGEGWDAPAINSLVLASNSASYMLSNQMRGRAIRIDPQRPDKVSNIWHLATISQPEALDAIGELATRFDWGGIAIDRKQTADIVLLERRFEAFAGIANDGSQQICTGLKRLDLARHFSAASANAASFARAADRAAIAHDWAASLGDAPSRAHVREVALPRHSPQRLVWGQTLEALGISGLFSGAAAGAYALVGALGVQPLTVLLAGAASAATLASLPKTGRAIRLAWRNGSLENSLTQVGHMVLFGLREAGWLSDLEYEEAGVRVVEGYDGSRGIFFDNLSRSADMAAMDALVELLGPVQNPRYLLVRRGGISTRGSDFHAIPALFSRNRQAADAFAQAWCERVGPCRAIWTRSEEGRKALLLARRASLAAGMQRSVKRRSEWR